MCWKTPICAGACCQPSRPTCRLTATISSNTSRTRLRFRAATGITAILNSGDASPELKQTQRTPSGCWTSSARSASRTCANNRWICRRSGCPHRGRSPHPRAEKPSRLKRRNPLPPAPARPPAASTWRRWMSPWQARVISLGATSAGRPSSSTARTIHRARLRFPTMPSSASVIAVPPPFS